MSNTGFFIGALMVAFFVFIVMRGELSKYLALIGIGNP